MHRGRRLPRRHPQTRRRLNGTTIAYPGNISYKRQARSLATPGAGAYERFLQGPLPGREDEWPYDSDWLTEIQAMGAENYYPPMR